MAYFLALSACVLISFILEVFFRPAPVFFHKRQKKPLLLTGLLLTFLFLLALLITQRPYFSACLSLLAVNVVLVVSNTKFKTLREPLVFSDFFLYLQAIKHPRLYLPFLGVAPLVGIVVSVLLIVFLGFYFEEPKHQLLSFGTLIVGALFIGCFALLKLISKHVDISQDVYKDSYHFGVLATLCCYGSQAADQRASLASSIKDVSPYSPRETIEAPNSTLDLADIVVVQSESFFDARMLTKVIKPAVLAEYDKCLSESYRQGRLKVPAWGANTMRTEFAFLTGLESETLGLAQYYPYQQLANIALPSIISELKSQGYWCVCIHPNASSFFMRDVFFKQLGFDEFVDADEFIGAKREGPYVADLEVSEKIKKVLNQTAQPCFIFAITMENHGPLHLENVSKNEWQEYYEQEPKADLEDLTVYLRHLKNADAMIARQLEFYKKRERDTVFAFYGDHVPAISGVFEALDYDDPRSDYFIWSSGHVTDEEESQMSVESLGKTILQLAESLSK